MTILREFGKKVHGRMAQWGIKAHVVVVNLLGIALVTALLVLGSLQQERILVFRNEANQLEALHASFLARVSQDAQTAEALATAFARNEAMQAAFAENDREALIRLALPTWLALGKSVGVAQCQFHQPPAVSFVRLHNLDAYGDDLSGFRRSVVDAISTKQPVSGLEVGRAGIGIRGVSPMWYGSTFLGSVEFGLSFDGDYLREYAAHYPAEVLVYLRSVSDVPLFDQAAADTPHAEADYGLYAATVEDDFPVPSEAVKAVIAETEPATIRRFAHEGERYAAYVAPLTDYSEETIGAVALVISRSETVARIARGQATAGLLGLGVMALVGYISYRSSARLLSPLDDLSRGAQRAAAGDFSTTIDVRSDNEVGRLATAFNHMVTSLNELMARGRDVAEQLSGSGDRLAIEMEEMNSAVDQVSIAVGELAKGAGTQAVRVEEASHAMAQLAEATSRIAENARRTGETSVAALRMVDDAHEVSRELAQRAKRIEEIVAAVDKVADQTNLLALNASIEAARAGEAGVGFAVVAQEVRRLAENSARLVGEIAALSREIEADLAVVRDRMDAAQLAVGQSATIAQETAVTTREQESSTDAMVAAVNEIAAVAEQSAASSEQIAVTVEQQAASIEHIAMAAQSLAALARELEARG